jgi:hypothetical protein
LDEFSTGVIAFKADDLSGVMRPELADRVGPIGSVSRWGTEVVRGLGNKGSPEMLVKWCLRARIVMWLTKAWNVMFGKHGYRL